MKEFNPKTTVTGEEMKKVSESISKVVMHGSSCAVFEIDGKEHIVNTASIKFTDRLEYQHTITTKTKENSQSSIWLFEGVYKMNDEEPKALHDLINECREIGNSATYEDRKLGIITFIVADALGDLRQKHSWYAMRVKEMIAEAAEEGVLTPEDLTGTMNRSHHIEGDNLEKIEQGSKKITCVLSN